MKSGDASSGSSKFGIAKDSMLKEGALGFIGNLAIGFTEVSILCSIFTTWNYGLMYGGPAEIFWGFLITGIMTIIISFSMAEICAAYPSAGCVYYWTGQVVPREHVKLASYICGWFNFFGNAAGDASFAYSFAGLFNAAVTVSGSKPYGDQTTVGVAIASLLGECTFVYP
jgi:amino acid transporter